MGILSSLKKAATFALDLTSAVAYNPLAILAPVKSAEKIKVMRQEIAAGDTSQAKTYIKTVGVQTALNVGVILAPGGTLGAAAAKTATTLGSKAITLGVLASPLIVGSSTIRQAAASFSPIAAGVKLGETIEKGVKSDDTKSKVAAAVVGTVAAGGLVAGGLLVYDYLKDYLKDKNQNKEDAAANDNSPVVSNVSQNLPTGNTTTTLPTSNNQPVLRETTSINVGKTKRKKYKKQSPQNNTIKNNIMINNNINSTKQQTKKYLKARVF